MQCAFKCLAAPLIRRTKNLQLLDGRHKTDSFLAPLFFLQSTLADGKNFRKISSRSPISLCLPFIRSSVMETDQTFSHLQYEAVRRIEWIVIDYLSDVANAFGHADLAAFKEFTFGGRLWTRR